MTNTNHLTDAITAACALKAITLTDDQMALAIRTLESDIAAHESRVAAWVAAGIDYDESAAVCNVSGKAKVAVRSALTHY